MPKWLTKRYAPLESSSSKLCPGLAHKGHALWTGTSRVEWHLSPLKFSQAVCTVDYSCWNGSFLFYMFVSGGSQKACAVGSTFLHKRYASLETSVSKMGVKHCQNVLRLRSNSSVSETSLSETLQCPRVRDLYVRDLNDSMSQNPRCSTKRFPVHIACAISLFDTPKSETPMSETMSKNLHLSQCLKGFFDIT